MENNDKINGISFSKMVLGGCENLRSNAKTINDLNVFPIPDGDTGDNMLLTMMGGAKASGENIESLSDVARRIADGMLLSARGNSGVILSRFFDGIAAGFDGKTEAAGEDLAIALCEGVKHAYEAVVEPAEGTILTVARCSADFAKENNSPTPENTLLDFITEGKRTLEKTPDMLPALKKAGVVDSGGAGLIYIAEGMLKGLNNSAEIPAILPYAPETDDPDFNRFGEDSILEFGYCTELLLRLQTSKCSPENFDIGIITEYLKNVGDSVVAFKTDSIVKIHVHTFTPHKVLSYCQRFGEFLKVKIENMSLQHNSSSFEEKEKEKIEKKKYGIVAVCSGDGIAEMFRERDCDVIIEGGQSMNPSAEDFINAFDKVNSETIFVFPNNSNVILTAKQAASMCEKADIRVIESRNIGEGYASISMFNSEIDDADELEHELIDAMKGVVCAEISRSVRDIDGIRQGDYIGFIGKNILSSSGERISCAYSTVDNVGMANFDICILIHGKDVSEGEASFLANYIERNYPQKEVYIINGSQEIYDYILIFE